MASPQQSSYRRPSALSGVAAKLIRIAGGGEAGGGGRTREAREACIWAARINSGEGVSKQRHECLGLLQSCSPPRLCVCVFYALKR